MLIPTVDLIVGDQCQCGRGSCSSICSCPPDALLRPRTCSIPLRQWYSLFAGAETGMAVQSQCYGGDDWWYTLNVFSMGSRQIRPVIHLLGYAPTEGYLAQRSKRTWRISPIMYYTYCERFRGVWKIVDCKAQVELPETNCLPSLIPCSLTLWLFLFFVTNIFIFF